MIIQETSTLIRIYDFNVPNELNDPNDPNVLNEIDQIKLPRLSCSESVQGLPCNAVYGVKCAAPCGV